MSEFGHDRDSQVIKYIPRIITARLQMLRLEMALAAVSSVVTPGIDEGTA